MSKLTRLCQGFILLNALSCVPAKAMNSPEWYWSGFLTQGLVSTDNNRFMGDSQDDVSTDFREMAVNATWRPASWVHLSGQLMSRRAGGVDDGDPKVDYLLAGFPFPECECGNFGMRIGRQKLPYGFYNETRDVAFTRPSIILPQAVYFDFARDLVLSADGIGFYGAIPLSDYRLDIDVNAGMPRKDKNAEYAYLGNDLSGHFYDSKGAIARVILSEDSETWKLGLTYGKTRLSYRPGALGELGLSQGDVAVELAMLSAQYNTERWSLTAEYLVEHVDWSELGGAFALDPKNDSEGYYIQSVYRITPQWELLASYSALYYEKDDRDGTKRAALTGEPAFAQWAKDVTLGVGWSPTPNIGLRAEWHRIQGTAWLPRQDNPSFTQTDKHWQLFMLQMTYRF